MNRLGIVAGLVCCLALLVTWLAGCRRSASGTLSPAEGPPGPAKSSLGVARVEVEISDISGREAASDVVRQLESLRDAGASDATAYQQFGDTLMVTLGPVSDPQTFAQKIDFAEVTSVEARYIKVGPGAAKVVRVRVEGADEAGALRGIVKRLASLTDDPQRAGSVGVPFAEKGTLWLYPVSDPKAFSEKIDFAEATTVEGRMIKITVAESVE